MYRKIVKKIISCTTVCTLILGMSSVNFDTAYAENGSGSLQDTTQQAVAMH